MGGDLPDSAVDRRYLSFEWDAVYKLNEIEEASPTLTYFGKETAWGAWLIFKIDESSGTVFSYASEKNNAGVSDYSTAWTNRGSLTYGDYSEVI